MKKSLIYIILILISFSAIGQNSSYWASAQYGTGAIIVHSQRMKHLTHFKPYKIEFNLEHQTSGIKDWHKTYNLPKVGYSLLMIDYKEPRLGKTIAFNVQFIYPFIRKEKINVNSYIGFGTGYNLNPFDNKTNYQNIVLGSRFTGCIYSKINTEFKISNSFTTDIGLSLIHFSNGATKLPNLGINVPNINLGLNYKISESLNQEKMEPIEQSKTSPFNYSIDFSNGWKDVVYSGGKRYWFNVFSLKSHYNLSDINRFSVGTEFFYDRSVNEFRENFGLKNNKNRNFKHSIVLGHELRVGKMYVVVNYGIYTFQAFNNVYAKAYQRYQLKFKVYDKYYFAPSLKAHKGNADLLECTVGLEL